MDWGLDTINCNSYTSLPLFGWQYSGLLKRRSHLGTILFVQETCLCLSSPPGSRLQYWRGLQISEASEEEYRIIIQQQSERCYVGKTFTTNIEQQIPSFRWVRVMVGFLWWTHINPRKISLQIFHRLAEIMIMAYATVDSSTWATKFDSVVPKLERWLS